MFVKICSIFLLTNKRSCIKITLEQAFPNACCGYYTELTTDVLERKNLCRYRTADLLLMRESRRDTPEYFAFAGNAE